MEKICVKTFVHVSSQEAWNVFTDPQHIVNWNNASADWHTSQAINNLMPGGSFNYRMESRDGKQGFDFSGVYTVVEPFRLIEYTLDGEDTRRVRVEFSEENGITHLAVTFDPETENSIEMQRGGWQSILNNFSAYVDQLAA